LSPSSPPVPPRLLLVQFHSIFLWMGSIERPCAHGGWAEALVTVST
jgi:hypothetical protein